MNSHESNTRDQDQQYLPRAESQPKQEKKQQWPDYVELLLDAQRPGMSNYLVASHPV